MAGFLCKNRGLFKIGTILSVTLCFVSCWPREPRLAQDKKEETSLIIMERKNIGTEKALQKIKHFCSYQERSHQEVKEKLYSFGLYKEDVEALISQMIEENYLNEERFAVAFAGGRFRIKKWGKIKIRYELKQKRISDYCIKKGLASINDEEYLITLEKLFKEKRSSLRTEKNIFIKKQKIRSFLMQRGFEPQLISELIQQM